MRAAATDRYFHWDLCNIVTDMLRSVHLVAASSTCTLKDSLRVGSGHVSKRSQFAPLHSCQQSLGVLVADSLVLR